MKPTQPQKPEKQQIRQMKFEMFCKGCTSTLPQSDPTVEIELSDRQDEVHDQQDDADFSDRQDGFHDQQDDTDVYNDSALLTDSFNMPHRITDDQQPILEGPRPTNPDETVLEKSPETFTLVEGASQRKQPLLVSSTGYAYSIKRTNKTSVLWRCTNRLKGAHCPATVVQKGNDFTHGRNSHVHSFIPNRVTKTTVYRDVRTTAQERLTVAGMEVVDAVVSEQSSTANFPKKRLLKRVANRNRSRLRPKEPKDLSFEVN
ncbi:uncharacterized protein LOC132748680 [Ruditapes philippinarum]|uniref:uncharacterized protein LOC132748680 n=1 Tax=Ruditapes philippinarum TaxID=129788 RepID=UPI00295C11BA|nr:uncharacterized protein LOC132748680 [Ruditapes philippinarum]